MSDMTAFIDIYCERTASGFWNEPLNALSNASFLLAAWWNYQRIDQTSWTSIDVWLCGLAACIGLGSFAFHTVPSMLTQWLDVIPIWLFVVSYTVALIHCLAGRRWRRTVFITVVGFVLLISFFVLTGEVITAKPPGDGALPLNGSLQYLPALIVLLVVSVIATFSKHPITQYLWAASALFLLALCFRTVDIQVCGMVATGTHFIWHLLIGAVVGVLLFAFGISSQNIKAYKSVEERDV